MHNHIICSFQCGINKNESGVRQVQVDLQSTSAREVEVRILSDFIPPIKISCIILICIQQYNFKLQMPSFLAVTLKSLNMSH